MTRMYDVAVLGLGAMGSAAIYQLSKRKGLSALGIDRFHPPHAMGSTHGDTRATRSAPFEGDELVPLVQRSIEIYAGELQEASGTRLFNHCGGLIIGRPGQAGYHNVENPFKSTVDAAERYGIPYELLSPDEVGHRFPNIRMLDDEQAYFEPSSGFLYAEECVTTHLKLASSNGATLKYDETVLAYEPQDSAVRVTTDRATYDVGVLIIAAGPWVKHLLPELAFLFALQRLALYWFELEDIELYDAYTSMPRVGWAFGTGAYAFPAIDGPSGGVKVASEEFIPITSPEAIDRRINPEDVRRMFENNVRGRLLGLGPSAVRATTCIYTMTPDSKFVIDRHPEHQSVIVASPCSGHGFKYSAAIGEALAQLATTGNTSLNIGAYRISRFLQSAADRNGPQKG
jgi:sarcosine oxidase